MGCPVLSIPNIAEALLGICSIWPTANTAGVVAITGLQRARRWCAREADRGHFDLPTWAWELVSDPRGRTLASRSALVGLCIVLFEIFSIGGQCGREGTPLVLE